MRRATYQHILHGLHVELPTEQTWFILDGDENETCTTFRCFDLDSRLQIGSITVADLTQDADEKNIDLLNEQSAEQWDQFIQRATVELTRQDGRELVRWMSSRLQNYSERKALLTAYILREGSQETQYLDLRIRIKDSNVCLSGSFAIPQAKYLASSIFQCITDSYIDSANREKPSKGGFTSG